MLTIKETLERVSMALVNDVPVLLMDGPVTRRVVAIHGDTENGHRWLTVITDSGCSHALPVRGAYVAEGIGLRKAYKALFIGPEQDLSLWPCNQSCIARVEGYCSVPDCKGCVKVHNVRPCRTPAEAAKHYHHFSINW